MNNDNIDFGADTQPQPQRVQRFAKVSEFEGEGKQIKFINFQKLQTGEGNPPVNADFVNERGYTYRLTFQDSYGEKYLDVRYDGFRDDLRAASPITKGEVGILRRERMPKYKWVWKKI